MKINSLTVLFAVMAAGLTAYAQQAPVMHHVSGEIGWVDLQLGQLELNVEAPTGTKTTAYKITQNETRVTDPADDKFLGVRDLRAGQYVTVETVAGQQDKIVPKIIVEPMPASEFQQVFGVLKEVDAAAGTFVVEEKVRIGQVEKSRMSSFVYDQEEVVVMRSPGKQPVELVLKPGDVVKVEFVERDWKQLARHITLYSPAATSTTITTTTTTTTQ